MAHLDSNFMGINLKNPIIAGSSGLTNSVNQIRLLEKAGVGAIVLKSLFEEQIKHESDSLIDSSDQVSYRDGDDYIRYYSRMNSVQNYLELITEAKAAVSIPIIASINCVSASEWIDFAFDLEKAGASAIEMNIYELSVDRNKTAEQIEKKYCDIVRSVTQKVTIPVCVKIGPYFTNLVRLVDQLVAHGAKAVTLFNRFYEPDFNLETLEFISSEVLSSPSDNRSLLRWTGIVKGALPQVEVVASTGIHNGSTVIKQLLAGAQVVQLCSTLYLNGFGIVTSMIDELEHFMKSWNFKQIDDFRGRMSYRHLPDPSLYERAQFMKYFSNRKL